MLKRFLYNSPMLTTIFMMVFVARAWSQSCPIDALSYAGEHWNQESDSEKINRSVNWFCSKKFESASSAQSAAASVGFEIPISASASESSSSFSQRQDEFCSNTERYSLARSHWASRISTINDAVARAVGNCISSQGQQGGLFAWVEQTLDPKAFSIKVALRKTNEVAHITDVVLSQPAVRCRPSLLGNLSGGLGKESQCSHDPKDPVAITIKASNFDPIWVGEAGIAAQPRWETPVHSDSVEGGARPSICILQFKDGSQVTNDGESEIKICKITPGPVQISIRGRAQPTDLTFTWKDPNNGKVFTEIWQRGPGGARPAGEPMEQAIWYLLLDIASVDARGIVTREFVFQDKYNPDSEFPNAWKLIDVNANSFTADTDGLLRLKFMLKDSQLIAGDAPGVAKKTGIRFNGDFTITVKSLSRPN